MKTNTENQRIVTLTNEIRDTIEKLYHLNDQASKLGFDISNTELAHYPSSGYLAMGTSSCLSNSL